MAPNSSAPWWRSFKREHWFVFTVATLAWLFDTMDQQFFNLGRDAAMEDLVGKAKATVYSPYTMSVFLVGWAVGGLIFGALGDRYGRARMLTVTLLLYSICTGLSAYQCWNDRIGISNDRLNNIIKSSDFIYVLKP